MCSRTLVAYSAFPGAAENKAAAALRAAEATAYIQGPGLSFLQDVALIVA